jgi:hypothetical protein
MQSSSFSNLSCLLLGAASMTAIAASCGGSVAPVGQDDDAGTEDASSSDGATDTGNGGDSGPTGDASKDAGGKPSCEQLRLQIDALREAATKCCPTCKSIQCGAQAEDLCCPATVTSTGSPEAQQLEAAVRSFKKSGCELACPAMPCRSGGPGICDPVTSHCHQ